MRMFKWLTLIWVQIPPEARFNLNIFRRIHIVTWLASAGVRTKTSFYCEESFMFTLLSFRYGLKAIERDLNPLTHPSTLYVCHILITIIIWLTKWAGAQQEREYSDILSSERLVSSVHAWQIFDYAKIG